MKTQKHRCRHCGCLFKPCRKVKKHRYCGKKACQLARKRKWQRARLQSDPIYRDDQQSAKRDWQANNPDYWKRYRQKNKRYTERNRHQQRLRNARLRNLAGNGSPVQSVAKMDALSVQIVEITSPDNKEPMVAKKDSIATALKTPLR